MAKVKSSRKLIVNRHVLVSRIKSRWSFFVWLAAALLAVGVYFHGGQFGGMSGSVFTRMQTSAPLITSRLGELLVDVGDVVEKGGLLAQMDTSVLEAEKALVVAQMRNLSSEVKTEEIQNLRLFDAAIIRLESELRDVRIKQIEDGSSLAALLPEFTRLEKLFESQLIDEQELMPLRMKIQELDAVTQAYPETIAQIEISLATAQEQKETISQQSKIAVELIEKEAEEQTHLLNLQIEACSLRAREDCVVSRIYFYPGDIVTEGDPVLASVVSGEVRVIGFLSEYNARDVVPGMKAFLTPVSGYGEVVQAEVVALTPEIYTLPDRASPIVSQAARGRRVVLKVDDECDLLPGEGVEIHFSRPWTTRLFWKFFGDKGGE